MHKIEQSEGFLGRLLGPLLKTGLPLMKNVLKPLAKNVLIPLGLTAAASATNAAIHEKMFGSGMTTLTVSNEEINDIMKIVKSHEESGLWRSELAKQLKMKQKNKKSDFSMLLGRLDDSLLGDQLTGKGTIRAGQDF